MLLIVDIQRIKHFVFNLVWFSLLFKKILVVGEPGIEIIEVCLQPRPSVSQPLSRPRNHAKANQHVPSPRLSLSEPWVPRKSLLETSLMKSSSESMLTVVDVGVPRTPFFRLVKLAGLARSMLFEVGVAESALECRSEVAVRCPWAAVGRGSLSKAASAAFLFRVLGGVMKVAAKMP
jgi:hypothetical protein